jgi:hypothetical protein
LSIGTDSQTGTATTGKDGQASVSQLADGQPQASQIADGQVQSPTVSQISDGQPQAPTVSQISDGQPQAPTVSQISDGQPQAPTVSQISDGQPQAPTVSQISDGQPQAPTVSQISDGQPQAPTVSQISDGQPQAAGGSSTRSTGTSSAPAACASGFLTLTLVNGTLKDQDGRFGYIAGGNNQFQFDNPVQAGGYGENDFSICSNGTIAFQGSTDWYKCDSGAGFYNLYNAEISPEACQPAKFLALACS